MLFQTNETDAPSKFSKKKRIIGLIILFTLFASTKILHSCDFEQIFNLRTQVYKELKQPEEALLLLKNNSIGILSNNPSMQKIHRTTGANVNIYQLKLTEKILKKNYKSEKSIALIELLKSLKFANQYVIISKNSIFILANHKYEIPSECHNQLTVFVKTNGLNYRYDIEGRELYLSEAEILNTILTQNGHIKEVSNKFSFFAEKQEGLSIVNRIHKTIDSDVFLAKDIEMRIIESGYHLSSIEMPTAAFRSAENLKDSNALYYLSKFHVSEKPKLTRIKTKYAIGLQSQNSSTTSLISAHFPINSNSNIYLKGSNNNSTRIKEFYLSNNNLLGDKNHFSIRLGRMSYQDFGLLIINQNFNLKKEAVFSLSGYSSLDQVCDTCIHHAINIGYEKKIPWVQVRASGNYEIQYLKDETKHFTQIALKKELKKKKSISLYWRPGAFNSASSGIDFIVEVPFFSSTNNSYSDISSFFEYSSNITSQVNRWIRGQNDFIFKNTPNYLRRNWKEYINFN